MSSYNLLFWDQFYCTSKSRTQKKQLIVIDQLWQVVMWGSGTDVSIFIFGPTTEAVRVLGEDGADDKPLVSRWWRWALALSDGWTPASWPVLSWGWWGWPWLPWDEAIGDLVGRCGHMQGRVEVNCVIVIVIVGRSWCFMGVVGVRELPVA